MTDSHTPELADQPDESPWTWTPSAGTPSNRAETQARRAWVVQRHHEGWTFERIGAALNVSQPRAHEIYWDAINSIADPVVKSVKAAHTELLGEVIRVANEVMTAQHLAHSNGRVVMIEDEDGVATPVLDDGPKLDAGRTIIAASARLMKMLGGDAPTQVETEVSVLRYEVVGTDVGGVV